MYTSSLSIISPETWILPKVMYLFDASLCQICFFPGATRCISSWRWQLPSSIFWRIFKLETLGFVAFNENLTGWQFHKLHIHVVPLKPPINLRRKIPIRLFSSRPHWTVLSMCKMTRQTFSRTYSLYSYYLELNLAQVWFVLIFLYNQGQFLLKYWPNLHYENIHRKFELSAGNSEGSFGLFSVPWSPDRSTRPRILEISDGIDICGKRLKNQLKAYFSFSNYLQK